MSEQVNVDDLEVFRQFRAALVKFAQAADQALANADSQVGRSKGWLEGEQTIYWQGQHRKRTEAAMRARDALRQKKLYKDASGRTPSAVDEEKEFARCMAGLEQAQQKLESIKRWIPRLEKEAGLYRGGVSRLNTMVSGEIPKAVALLDRLAARLEEYVQIEAPAMPAPGAEMAPAGESMARGGSGDAVIPPAVESVPEKGAADPAGSDEKAKEGGDVAAGS